MTIAGFGRDCTPEVWSQEHPPDKCLVVCTEEDYEDGKCLTYHLRYVPTKHAAIIPLKLELVLN